MKLKTLLLGFTLLATVGITACGGNPVPVGIPALQSTETVLGVIQDTEAAIFAAGKESPAVHKEVSAALAVAFQAQIDATTALKAFQPGDPIPPSFTGYLTAVQNVIVALQKLDVSDAQQSILAQAQRIVASLQDLITALGVK